MVVAQPVEPIVAIESPCVAANGVVVVVGLVQPRDGNKSKESFGRCVISTISPQTVFW